MGEWRCSEHFHFRLAILDPLFFIKMPKTKRKSKFRIKSLFEQISPILIDPKPTSITVSLSKRFLLFKLMQKVVKKIEDDPYLNFISLLKNYKVLGKFLHGTIHELHRDRNKSYFRRFFMEPELYKLVKADLEWVYEKNKDVRLTITKRGVLIYDNYKTNQFNVLLLTIHAGTWMPKDVGKKQLLTPEQRFVDEDVDTNRIYSDLVLTKGGIWIDKKMSRFACDYNRSPERAIYFDKSEQWLDILWKEKLSDAQRKRIIEGYTEFYFTLSNLVDSYRFNIIFDGHSMRSEEGRPDISFGTTFIPKFYMPIVMSMKNNLKKAGYQVVLNQPYQGGYILQWLQESFPDVFICAMEVNKKLYMTKNHQKSIKSKVNKLAEDIARIFDIEIDTL